MRRGVVPAVLTWLFLLLGLTLLAPEPMRGLIPAAQAQEVAAPPDYDEWNSFATRAEKRIADRANTDAQLEELRANLVERRAAFQAGQNADQARIATARAQIDALGPAPAEGATEAPEIASRRRELTEALVLLEAPGIAADEAYRRADGLIRQIDMIIRERQADAFLQLWPAPVNPANWPAGLKALSDAGTVLGREIAENWQSERAREGLNDRLPVILGLVALALLLLTRARGWIERLSLRLRERASARGRNVLATFVSCGQVILPVLGMVALWRALEFTGMAGPRGTELIAELPRTALLLFAARWIGNHLFPRAEVEEPLLHLPPERRAEGRIHSALLGLTLGLQKLRDVAVSPSGDGAEAANATLSFPLLVLASVLVFRIGQLLRLHVQNEAADGTAAGISGRLIGGIGQGAKILGLLGPGLAAVGYVSAATATVYPAAMTLSVMGLVLILQRLVGDIHALITRTEDEARDGLVPVLMAFALALLAVPLLALIWGARTSDLAEVWTRFQEGFTLGGARISPSSFMTFGILFAIGYGLTRLFQGALRASILPKTRLDQGGQNAIVSGVGYIGVFLAALVGISAAGIDLSSFALVAGALSLGIGFGLQNIVQNFVSGIILLIERPVSEGDWIEVGGVQGRVRAISVRSTRIETFDRTDVIVPNADLVSGMVTNWTRFNLTGRLILPVNVAIGSDTRQVERVLMEIAEAQPLVVMNPAPSVLLMGIGTSVLNFEIRVILRDVNFKLDVQSAMNHAVIRRFEEEGINTPIAPQDIWLRHPELLSALQVLATAQAASMTKAGAEPEAVPEPAAAG